MGINRRKYVQTFLNSSLIGSSGCVKNQFYFNGSKTDGNGQHHQPSAESICTKKSINIAENKILSTRGSGRATHYLGATKIIRVENKTHVCWLDSFDNKFLIQIRSFNHTTKKWSHAKKVGTAVDNHGGPALTIDSENHLHICYGPHSHPMRYRRSTNPNQITSWESEQRFGNALTYPGLFCTPDNTLILTARWDSPDNRQFVLFKRPKDGNWVGPHPIVENPSGNYARFPRQLAWGPNHQRLHLVIDIITDYDVGAGVIGYLYSDDYGETWQTATGDRIDLPATPETVTTIVQSDSAYPRCFNIAVDSENRPYCVYSYRNKPKGEFWITQCQGSKWKTIKNIAQYFPDRFKGWAPNHYGIEIVRESIFIPLTITKPVEPPNDFGHPSTEVVLLYSLDNMTSFKSVILSEVDPNQPNWGVNHERPTGHNLVNIPRLMYTSGIPGKDLNSIISNDVKFVELVEM
jgi:hypothetical protein